MSTKETHSVVKELITKGFTEQQAQVLIDNFPIEHRVEYLTAWEITHLLILGGLILIVLSPWRKK